LFETAKTFGRKATSYSEPRRHMQGAGT